MLLCYDWNSFKTMSLLILEVNETDGLKGITTEAERSMLEKVEAFTKRLVYTIKHIYSEKQLKDI